MRYRLSLCHEWGISQNPPFKNLNECDIEYLRLHSLKIMMSNKIFVQDLQILAQFYLKSNTCILKNYSCDLGYL